MTPAVSPMLLVAGAQRRDTGPGLVLDIPGLPPVPLPPLVALAATVVGVVVLAGVAVWLWWRRDHRGWATGADLARHLSVAALRRCLPQIRPGLQSRPGRERRP